MAGWASTATTGSCCAPRSWVRPTASSPCSPGAPGGSAPSPRACAGPSPGSAPGWSRSPTSTCCCTRAGRWTYVTQAETVRAYGAPLAADYPRYTAGIAMLETAERFTPGRRSPRCGSSCCWSAGCARWARGPRPAPGARRLPAALARRRRVRARPGRVRGVRDRRSRPPTARAGAGGAGGGSRAFAIAAGGLVCRSCRPPGAATAVRPHGRPDERAAARRLGQRRRSERRHQVECSGLVAAYLQWHLEHSIRSLRHVEHA